MKILHLAVMLLVLVWAAQASALTVDDIERLKKAGVSDAVIQKMIEQEGAGVKATGPMVETEDQVTFSAGKGNKERIQRNREHEQYKEKKALDALQGVIIDTRADPSASTLPAKSGAASQ